MPGDPRFAADAMFARLARWLRVLGFDTAFDPAIDDHDLVALASAEDRILLTRDRHLVEHLRPVTALLITSNTPLEQLREVASSCDLNLGRELFTRCVVCNATLRDATATEITKMVPGDAQAVGGPIRRCPNRGRIFWPGSHVRRMRAVLARTFPEIL